MPGAPREQHRCLLYQGPLRLSEKQGKMDIHAFLFTDMMLLTKAKKMDKFKVVKPPLCIDKVKVHVLKDPGTFLVVYLNEYRTVVHAYVLQASQNVVQAKWIEMIDKAKNLYQAVLQNDGSKCLTADDAGVQSPSATASQSPTLKQKHSSWKVSNESLDQGSLRVPMVTVTSTSPKMRRHLSGSDGNLSLVGIAEQSRLSAVARMPSYNDRKSKSRHDNPHRRSRADSRVMRSTSDPHNKPARDDVVSASGLSRSSSLPQSAKPIADTEPRTLSESSVDLRTSRSMTSLSEVEITESVDVDEIQMSLSPDVESPDNSPRIESAKNVDSVTTSGDLISEVSRPSSDVNRNPGRDSSEKIKLLLAQKLSKSLSAKKDSERDDDLSNFRDYAERVPRRQSDRKRSPRSSSVDRPKRTGERKPTGDPGQVADSVSSISLSEPKSTDGRKAKLARSSSSSGSRQLPDPNQISGKSRSLPKTQCSDSLDNVQQGISGKNWQNGLSELNGSVLTSSKSKVNSADPSVGHQDFSDSLESLKGSGSGSQAPPIKAPLISGLSLNRNGSNGADTARKRTHLPKRSPVITRKCPTDSTMRKSMDEQLLEPKHSPPLRRSKSEADTPIETLRPKSKNSEGTYSKSKARFGSEERDKTRSRSRKSSAESNSGKSATAVDELVSGTKPKSEDSSQGCQITNSHGMLANSGNLKEQGSEDSRKLPVSTGEKTRRQIKKYRGRDSRKVVEDNVVASNAEDASRRLESLRPIVEPLMLESSEYV